jgi:hypothetical protein
MDSWWARAEFPRLQPALPSSAEAILTVAALPALIGRDTSGRDNQVPQGQVPIQAQAAVNDAGSPTQTGVLASPTSPATSTGVATAYATPNVLTPIIATRVVYATNVAEFRQELRTSVALSHAPTITPGTPQARSSPTP